MNAESFEFESVQTSADVCLHLEHLLPVLQEGGIVPEDWGVDDLRLDVSQREVIEEILGAPIAVGELPEEARRIVPLALQAIEKADKRLYFYEEELKHPNELHDGAVNENILEHLEGIEDERFRGMAIEQLADILFADCEDVQAKLKKLQFEKVSVEVSHREFENVYEKYPNTFAEFYRIAIEGSREEILKTIDKCDVDAGLRYLHEIYDLSGVRSEETFKELFLRAIGGENATRVREVFEGLEAVSREESSFAGRIVRAARTLARRKRGSIAQRKVSFLDKLWFILRRTGSEYPMAFTEEVREALKGLTREVLGEAVAHLEPDDFVGKYNALKEAAAASGKFNVKSTEFEPGGMPGDEYEVDNPPQGVQMVNHENSWVFRRDVTEHLLAIPDFYARMRKFSEIAQGVGSGVGYGELMNKVFEVVVGTVKKGGALKDTIDAQPDFNGKLAVLEWMDRCLQDFASPEELGGFAGYVLGEPLAKWIREGADDAEKMRRILDTRNKLEPFEVIPMSHALLTLADTECRAGMLAHFEGIETAEGKFEELLRVGNLEYNVGDDRGDNEVLKKLLAVVLREDLSYQSSVPAKLQRLNGLNPEPGVDWNKRSIKGTLFVGVAAQVELDVAKEDEEGFFVGCASDVRSRRAYLEGFEFIGDKTKKCLSKYLDRLEEERRAGVSF